MSAHERIAGRYRIEHLLGRGGMGAVYAVHDEGSGQKLALKRLLANATPRTTRLFELEYETLASLCHPGIVQVYDYQRDTDGAFYTMELVQGQELGGQAPLPWRQACECLRDIASSLALLHARRLVHRDLTPRNLLRTESGCLKLIDFGTLASFGQTDDVVGTLQYMAPETLGDGAIDQRADLFSLGALGYWLLTGVHAFPARNISELEQSWRHTPASPSSLVALLNDPKYEPPPPALDDLIAQLLQIDPDQRPTNTAHLIEQLNTLADLAPEAPDSSAQGYLASKAFVGRAQERERVRAALTPAARGLGSALLFEGVSGVGLTRLLRELAVTARLSGALVASADASAGAQPYGAALGLLLTLLPSLSEELRKSDQLRLLARLSKELHERLDGCELPALPGVASEARVRYQGAFHELVLRASRERPLVLLIDDLNALDEESQALFAALAHSTASAKLVLLACARQDRNGASSPAISSYRHAAVRMRLTPLSADETLELLRSLFGSVRYLERVADRLHRLSEGIPGHCIELASHLVRSGQARYREGMWVLPAELSDDDLPPTRDLAWRVLMDGLSAEARALAATLSVQPRSVLSLAHCVRLASLQHASEPETRDLLAQLVRAGILRESSHGYRFAHEQQALALYDELTAELRVRAHRALGEALLEQAGDDPLGKLRACPHFLRAGDRARGQRLALALAGSVYEDFEGVVRAAAPLCEEIYALLKAQGADDYALLEPLAVLATAGYFLDHRYAMQYGDQAMAVMDRVLRLTLASRLQRWLGKKLGLYLALSIAAVNLWLRRARVPTLKVAVMRVVAASAALGGTAACGIDPAGVERYTKVLEPFSAMGTDHALGLGVEFVRTIAIQVQDRPSLAVARLRWLIERYESSRPIRDLPSDIRTAALAGCYFSLGVLESFREGADLLALADKIETFGPLFAMGADYLRASYYNNQGMNEQGEHFRQRAEVHAIHLGSAWQVDTWAPADATKRGLRAFDALVVKQAVQELARFSKQMPALKLEERRARGTYLALRGKHQEALAALDVDEPKPYAIGWARARGTLATVYNTLGEHERALAVCKDALAHLGPEDLEYTVLNLNVEIEYALAKAGLGDAAGAKADLDRLIAHHAPKQGPLTLGLLHRARFQVAMRENDLDSAREQLTKLEGWYLGTNLPSLREMARSLRRELARAESPHGAEPGSGTHEVNDSHVTARAELLLKRDGSLDRAGRAKKVLQLAREMTQADDGFILFAGGEPPLVALGTAPSNELLAWAEHELASANDYDAELRTEEIDTAVDPYKVVAGLRFFATPLQRAGNTHSLAGPTLDPPGVLGVLVLGFVGVPRLPERATLSLMSSHLERIERTAQEA